MSIALLAIAAFEAFGLVMAISVVGKERKPLSPRNLVWVVAVTSAIIVILVLAALKIGLP